MPSDRRRANAARTSSFNVIYKHYAGTSPPSLSSDDNNQAQERLQVTCGCFAAPCVAVVGRRRWQSSCCHTSCSSWWHCRWAKEGHSSLALFLSIKLSFPSSFLSSRPPLQLLSIFLSYAGTPFLLTSSFTFLFPAPILWVGVEDDQKILDKLQLSYQLQSLIAPYFMTFAPVEWARLRFQVEWSFTPLVIGWLSC